MTTNNDDPVVITMTFTHFFFCEKKMRTSWRSNSPTRASHESSSHERGSIVRKADVHSEFSTKREESFSLSLSLFFFVSVAFFSPPSLFLRCVFRGSLHLPRRCRPNGNVKVTWTTVCTRSRVFRQPDTDTTEVHRSNETPTREKKDRCRSTEPKWIPRLITSSETNLTQVS